MSRKRSTSYEISWNRDTSLPIPLFNLNSLYRKHDMPIIIGINYNKSYIFKKYGDEVYRNSVSKILSHSSEKYMRIFSDGYCMTCG